MCGVGCGLAMNISSSLIGTSFLRHALTRFHKYKDRGISGA